MTLAEYRQALAKAKKDLATAQRQRQQLELRMGRLDHTIASLQALIQPDKESDIGLTDAIRTVIHGASQMLRAPEVRDKVESLGTSLKDHTNAMASVHAILHRLVKSDEVLVVERPSGKYFWWTQNGPPPKRPGDHIISPAAGNLRLIASRMNAFEKQMEPARAMAAEMNKLVEAMRPSLEQFDRLRDQIAPIMEMVETNTTLAELAGVAPHKKRSKKKTSR